MQPHPLMVTAVAVAGCPQGVPPESGGRGHCCNRRQVNA